MILNKPFTLPCELNIQHGLIILCTQSIRFVTAKLGLVYSSKGWSSLAKKNLLKGFLQTSQSGSKAHGCVWFGWWRLRFVDISLIYFTSFVTLCMWCVCIVQHGNLIANCYSRKTHEAYGVFNFDQNTWSTVISHCDKPLINYWDYERTSAFSRNRTPPTEMRVNNLNHCTNPTHWCDCYANMTNLYCILTNYFFGCNK